MRTHINGSNHSAYEGPFAAYESVRSMLVRPRSLKWGPMRNNRESSLVPTLGTSKDDISVAPVISPPRGCWAIGRSSENFDANSLKATGSMTMPIAISPGRSGFDPQLSPLRSGLQHRRNIFREPDILRFHISIQRRTRSYGRFSKTGFDLKGLEMKKVSLNLIYNLTKFV
jgi:hypothetical protein